MHGFPIAGRLELEPITRAQVMLAAAQQQGNAAVAELQQAQQHEMGPALEKGAKEAELHLAAAVGVPEAATLQAYMAIAQVNLAIAPPVSYTCIRVDLSISACRVTDPAPVH